MVRVKEVWQSMALTPALMRLMQDNLEFQTSLSYIARSCLKKIKQRKN
jgi:hypothetical protein